MNPLEAAVLIALLALPLHPRYLRTPGMVVVRESALDAHGEAIGEYRGHPIWRTVEFKGMQYRYCRVTECRRKENIGRGELYLEPGLVYVTD